MNSMTDPAGIDQRLATLERRCARLTRLTIVLSTVGLLAGTAAFGAVRQSDVVDATRLILREAAGRPRVELAIDAEGRLELRFSGKSNPGGRPIAQLRLIDENGDVVAQLGSELVHQAGR